MNRARHAGLAGGLLVALLGCCVLAGAGEAVTTAQVALTGANGETTVVTMSNEEVLALRASGADYEVLSTLTVLGPTPKATGSESGTNNTTVTYSGLTTINISGAPVGATITSVTVRVRGLCAYADYCAWQLRNGASSPYDLSTSYDEIEYDHTNSGISTYNGQSPNQTWTMAFQGSVSGENMTNWYITINYTYTAEPVGPTAGFTADTTSGPAPLTVNFADTSTAGTSSIDEWAWDFGDEDSSIEPDPSHTYVKAGTYTVSLTVTTDVDNSIVTKTDLITVDMIAGQSYPGWMEEGDTAVLRVDVTGATEPVTYEWFKQGIETALVDEGNISGSDSPRSPSVLSPWTTMAPRIACALRMRGRG